MSQAVGCRLGCLAWLGLLIWPLPRLEGLLQALIMFRLPIYMESPRRPSWKGLDFSLLLSSIFHIHFIWRSQCMRHANNVGYMCGTCHFGSYNIAWLICPDLEIIFWHGAALSAILLMPLMNSGRRGQAGQATQAGKKNLMAQYEYGALKAWAMETIAKAGAGGISLKSLREVLEVSGIQRQCQALIEEGLVVRRETKEGALYFPKAARAAKASKTSKAQGRKPAAKAAKPKAAAAA